MKNHRESLLQSFFPLPRVEPSYGLEIELTRPGRERDLRVDLRVDELAEPLAESQVEALVALAAATFREAFGPGFVQPRVQVLRNLTEQECREW